MKPSYMKILDENLLFMKNIKEKEKKHECDSLVFNQDITHPNIKSSIEEIKN